MVMQKNLMLSVANLGFKACSFALYSGRNPRHDVSRHEREVGEGILRIQDCKH